MEFDARYQDGVTAEVRDAHCVIDFAAEPAQLVILEPQEGGIIIDRWAADESYLLHSRMAELRIANRAKPAGARLGVTGIDDMRSALSVLPSLTQGQRRDTFKQVRIILLATLALGSVIVAYLFGVPLIADQLVALVPPAWEVKIGDTAARQIEASLTDRKGFVACEPDRSSPANRAIANFVDRAFDGLNSPFRPVVTVTRTEVPNAFALPGGRAYYFSALLQASRTPDEFAGVLAHELGHVYYRHGMETLIASSATGLLVGFVLGDLTGVSVAGAIGSSLIDNRFSRRAEAQADTFAGFVADRLGYDPKGLVDLLDRVAKDDEFTRALALFSNHPLTEERRRALQDMAKSDAATVPAFTDVEWQAIRNMCPPPAPPPLPKRISEAPPA